MNIILEKELNLDLKSDNIASKELECLTNLLYELNFYKEFKDYVLSKSSIDEKKRNL